MAASRASPLCRSCSIGIPKDFNADTRPATSGTSTVISVSPANTSNPASIKSMVTNDREANRARLRFSAVKSVTAGLTPSRPDHLRTVRAQSSTARVSATGSEYPTPIGMASPFDFRGNREG